MQRVFEACLPTPPAQRNAGSEVLHCATFRAVLEAQALVQGPVPELVPELVLVLVDTCVHQAWGVYQHLPVGGC